MPKPERGVRERLCEAPRESVRSSIEGLRTKVVGQIRLAGGLLRSPFFEVDCALYRIAVTQRDDARELMLLDETHATPLWIDDGTGSALIRGGAIVSDLQAFSACERSNVSGPGPDVEPLGREEEAVLGRLLRRAGRGSSFEDDYALVIREFVLRIPARVAVSGVVVGELGGAGRISSKSGDDPFRSWVGERAGPRRRLVELGPGRRSPLMLSDHPHTLE